MALFGQGLTLTLQPPENQYIQIGAEAKLMCQSSEPIRSCTWTTPYDGVFSLESGLRAESGRLEFFAEDETKDCGILISTVEEKDYGQWTCSVGVVENGEITTANGQSFLFKASKPEEIVISAPTNNGSIDIDGSEKEISCKITNARPEPIVSWYIGQEELVGYETRGSLTKETTETTPSFTQTLVYRPKKEHANQTLKCVIDHVGLDAGEKMETGIYLRFPEDVNEAAFTRKQETVEPAESSTVFVAIAIAVIVSFVVIGSVYLVVRRLRLRRNHEVMDEEKAPEEKVDGNSSNGEAGAPNDDDQAALSPKKTMKFTQRMTALFGKSEKGAKTEDKIDAKEEECKEEVKQVDEQKEEGDEVEKTMEEVLEIEKTEPTEEEINAGKPSEVSRKSRFGAIFDRLKQGRKSSAKAPEKEESSEMTDKSDEDKAEKATEDEKENEKAAEKSENDNADEDEKESKKLPSDTPV